MRLAYYICRLCADKLGAVWPEGHVATQHEGLCDCCDTRQGLCSIDDWDWPKGRPKHFKGAGRD